MNVTYAHLHSSLSPIPINVHASGMNTAREFGLENSVINYNLWSKQQVRWTYGSYGRQWNHDVRSHHVPLLIFARTIISSRDTWRKFPVIQYFTVGNWSTAIDTREHQFSFVYDLSHVESLVLVCLRPYPHENTGSHWSTALVTWEHRFSLVYGLSHVKTPVLIGLRP